MSGFVFPGTGQTGHLVEPKKGWKRVIERADIADVRIHDLRHTFGTSLARSGAGMLTIRQAMNHKSTRSSLNYIHLATNDVRDHVNRATEEMLGTEVSDKLSDVL